MAQPSTRFTFRAVFPIVRAAGLGYVTAVFAVIFFGTCGLLAAIEPQVSFGDAIWLCFQAFTTIGFGDVNIVRPASRVALMILSLFSIIYLAVITGVVVAYCTDKLQHRAEICTAQYLSDLENLEKLSPEQLAELSQKIRQMR